MNIAYPCSSNPQSSIAEYTEMIQTYLSQCPDPILDSAYYYGNTRTEIILGEILESLNCIPKITTKANPWFDNDFTNGQFGQLSAEGVERQLATSLAHLRLPKVDTFFLHCPDPETPIEETLSACHDLWRHEKYDTFGISNFSKIQVREIQEVCENGGYNPPLVYQGMYNMISRKVEEIVPLLREYRMDFWAYNPLAGGLLTGKYAKLDANTMPDSRFKNNAIYQSIFWKPELVNTVHDVFGANPVNQHIEIAYEWLHQHLSDSDKIIVGASNVAQLRSNIQCFSNPSDTSLDFLKKNHDMVERFRWMESTPNYYY
jgi:aflatoxin B1 aldehyde reductase